MGHVVLLPIGRSILLLIHHVHFRFASGRITFIRHIVGDPSIRLGLFWIGSRESSVDLAGLLVPWFDNHIAGSALIDVIVVVTGGHTLGSEEEDGGKDGEHEDHDEQMLGKRVLSMNNAHNAQGEDHNSGQLEM